MLRPAIMSGVLSDMLTASLAKHSRVLRENRYFNGHPDLIVHGVYAGNAVKAGKEGVEVKTTQKAGGAVDTHGAREQWMCVFVYDVDTETEPATRRRPVTFAEVSLGHVPAGDFRRNPRGELGTRTATLHKDGIQKEPLAELPEGDGSRGRSPSIGEASGRGNPWRASVLASRMGVLQAPP
jgi:hypothetical protein